MPPEPETSPHRLFDGLLTRSELTTETGWQWRTVLRREAEGLPVIKLGATKLYPIEKVRAWILGREPNPAPVRRGRPRKAA